METLLYDGSIWHMIGVCFVLVFVLSCYIIRVLLRKKTRIITLLLAVLCTISAITLYFVIVAEVVFRTIKAV